MNNDKSTMGRENTEKLPAHAILGDAERRELSTELSDMVSAILKKWGIKHYAFGVPVAFLVDGGQTQVVCPNRMHCSGSVALSYVRGLEKIKISVMESLVALDDDVVEKLEKVDMD